MTAATMDSTPLPCPRCEHTLAPEEATCAQCGGSRIVCERFRVTKVLGQGGMGRIYEGLEESRGERVAVKMLSLGGTTDWRLRELFERSTHVLMALSHPLLPKVHAFEQDDAGRFILVRDIYDGGTLEERIGRNDRRLAPAEVTRMLEALLDLLVYLQARVPPVIHRDIKPSNVMFRSADDDAPVLVDFDSVAAPEGRRSGLTIVGTPGYTAPEQFAGEASPSTDVYSLGATMPRTAQRSHGTPRASQAGPRSPALSADVAAAETGGGTRAWPKCAGRHARVGRDVRRCFARRCHGHAPTCPGQWGDDVSSRDFVARRSALALRWVGRAVRRAVRRPRPCPAGSGRRLRAAPARDHDPLRGRA